MKLQHPLQKHNTKALLTVLSKEASGYYLLGNHQFWHGGVHFTDSEKHEIHFKDVPVGAIADGEIVAWRINKDHQILDLTPPVAEGVSTNNGDNTSAGQGGQSAQEPLKDDPNKFKYATSFCLIKHEYKSPDAPIKLLQDNTTKILRVTSTNGLTRWADKENAQKLTGRFGNGSLFEVISEGQNNASLYMAEGYPLDKNGEREQADGKDLLCWINTGSKSQYQYVEILGGRVDWSDPESITVQANDAGYSYNPAFKPVQTSDCKTIAIPSGTKLTLVPHASTSTFNGLVYYQVQADKQLTATYKVSNAEDATEQSAPYDAGKIIWYPITNKVGVTRTGKDANNKDVPVATADPKTNKLTFYSLYMHLLPWDAYDFNQEEKEEDTKTYLRRSGNMSLRNSAGGATVKTSTNALFEVIDEADNPKNVGTLRYTHVYIINEDGTRKEQQDYWINTGSSTDQTTYGANVTESSPADARASKHEVPRYLKYGTTIQAKALDDVQVCVVRNNSTNHNKPTLGELDFLEKGNEFSYHFPNDIITHKKLVVGDKEEDTELIKITLKSGQGKNGGLSNAQEQLYLISKNVTPKNVEEKVTPKSFDKVENCSPPIFVKAGETLGYLGLYQSPVNAKPENGKDNKHQLHFEIFSNDTETRINDFLDNKAKVTTGKKYLKIPKKTYVMFCADINKPVNVPPAGLPVAYFNSTDHLIKDWVLPLSEVPVVKDNKGDEWYQPPVRELTGSTLAESLHGWVRKGVGGVEELCQYELRKLGFTVIEETDDQSNGDIFVDAGSVKTRGGLEIKDFFQTIMDEIDKLVKDDGEVTFDEIQAAYKREDIADTLQKIIGYHPTEWKDKLDAVEIVASRIRAAIESIKDEQDPKKKTLQEILSNTPENERNEKIITTFAGEETLHFMKQEQKRIDKLVFWDEVNDLKSSSNKVHHFHPVVFVEYAGEPSIPPWLEVAMEEARKWANITEDKITTNYHKEVGYPANTMVGTAFAWCASFVNYCFKQVDVAYPTVSPAYSQAYIGNKNFFKIDKPCLGSIRVSLRDGGGHVTFVFAKDKKGMLLCLGGNQGQQLRLMDFSISGESAKYYLPISYKEIYESNKALLEELDVYTDEASANKELFEITIKGGYSQS